jgi:lysophospholipase L1-like esterase
VRFVIERLARPRLPSRRCPDAGTAPARRSRGIGAIVVAFIATLAGCTTADDPPTTAEAPPPARIVRCVDDGLTWRASVTDSTGAAIPSVRIDSLDATGAPADDAWTIVTTDPETRERVEDPTAADDAHGRTLTLDRSPRVVSPDGRCTLYLSPPAPPPAGTVAIVGDSLAAGIVASIDDRASLEDDARARGLGVLVDGQSGAPWADIDGTGGVMLDEIRGAASIDDVLAVVVVLGANDAILAAFPAGDARAAQQARTDEAIEAGMRILRDVGCVVITTPPDHPIRNFDLGESYALEARRVGEVLRALVERDDRLVLADFAALSRSHHLPDGTTGDWFSGDDELHPNAEGTEALRATILDAVLGCQPREPVNQD